MKIDFKVALTDFDGKPILNDKKEPLYLNKLLANSLGQNPHTDTGIGFMDAMKWATAINNGEVVDLEKSEQELLKTFIEKNATFTAFAKRDLTNAMNPKPEQKTNGKNKPQPAENAEQ